MTGNLRSRVVYKTNPLQEVVCQLRFPKLLAIQAKPPISFQENILGDYPNLVSRNTIGIDLSALLSRSEEFHLPHEMAYDFSDQNDQYKITLCSDFIAVSTRRYVRWEEYSAQVKIAVDALLASYAVSKFTRVGLRYINRIDLADLGLLDALPSELVCPDMLGLAGTNAFSIHEHQSVSVLNLDDGAQARTVFQQEALTADNARTYIIDCDVYTENVTKADSDDALRTLDEFHDHESHLFRWIVQDRLHEALGPTEA